MAFTPVVYAPQPKVTDTSAKQGGGKTGSLIGGAIGGVAGGIAGFASGGPAGAVVGATGGTAGGMSLGNAIGEMIDPSRAASQAIDRRIQVSGPQIVHSERSDALKQSLAALSTAPEEMKQQYGPPLVAGYLKSLHMDATQPDMGVV